MMKVSRGFPPFYGLLLFISAVSTQAREGDPPVSYRQALPKTVIHWLPEINPSAEKALGESEAKPGTAMRFAKPTKTNLSPDISGNWTSVHGGKIWRLQFASKGATDLNFGFDQFDLPPGAALYFLSNTARMPKFYDGPYTHADNAGHGQFWSAPIPGGSVTVELFLPDNATSAVKLHLTQVNLGFRDVYKISGGPGLSKQGLCNNDVVCPEGDPWRNEIRAVAAYTVGGTDTCTGTMMMDAQRSFTPYFLTAFHCGLDATNAASVVTIWNYESPTCGQLAGGSRLQTVSGAQFRASDRQTDMALIELSATPPTSFNVYWAGWDRSDTIPMGSVGIHHPRVDEKAISFNLDALTYASNCIIGEATNTHWNVDNWEDGTTEPGSSGSALFHPDNKGVIGFLSGGLASCTDIDFDCYGRFGAAWLSGSSSAQRLQPWLDPANNGPMVVPGGDATVGLILKDGFEDL